jgi:hypothetical protein
MENGVDLEGNFFKVNQESSRLSKKLHLELKNSNQWFNRSVLFDSFGNIRNGERQHSASQKQNCWHQKGEAAVFIDDHSNQD